MFINIVFKEKIIIKITISIRLYFIKIDFTLNLKKMHAYRKNLINNMNYNIMKMN
jgi:hypothetical protein